MWLLRQLIWKNKKLLKHNKYAYAYQLFILNQEEMRGVMLNYVKWTTDLAILHLKHIK